MKSTSPGPHSCADSSCSNISLQPTCCHRLLASLASPGRAWSASSNHFAQALPRCQGEFQCDSSNSCHDEGLQAPGRRPQRLPCHPDQSSGRVSPSCAMLDHCSKRPVQKGPWCEEWCWHMPCCQGFSTPWSALEFVWTTCWSTPCSGKHTKVLNPWFCATSRWVHSYQVCMWMLPCPSPNPMLLEHAVTATRVWDHQAPQPHTFPKHLATSYHLQVPTQMGFCIDLWCAHCLQDLWMPFVRLTAWGHQNQCSSTWLYMFPSNHVHKQLSCSLVQHSPDMFIVKNINHWKCIAFQLVLQRGKCHVSHMGRLSGFHHGLNCVAQDVDHDTGTHGLVMFQLNFTVMLKLVHHSHWVLSTQKEFQPFILQQIFCQVYQGCSRLTHSPSQGFPALSLITWHFVHMGSTQQTKRSAGALGRSPFVSDCMGACLRVLGVCWILWGNCDLSTFPTSPFLNICIAPHIMKSLQTWPGISIGGFGGFRAAVLCFDPGTGLDRGCTCSGATFGVTWWVPWSTS